MKVIKGTIGLVLTLHRQQTGVKRNGHLISTQDWSNLLESVVVTPGTISSENTLV